MSKFCVHSKVGVSLVEANGYLNPCCKYKKGSELPSIFEVNTLNQLHKAAAYQTITTTLENGSFPSGCSACQKQEDAGMRSRRIFTNDMFDKHDLFADGYIQDMEISLDFTCNMMCRMCNPGASSKWGAARSAIEVLRSNDIDLDVPDAKNYKRYQDQFQLVMSNTDLSHARHIKIEGGEPFYAKNLAWFIDKLYNEVSDKAKLFLNIVTNGSVFPDTDILEKLKQFNTTITFSLDAVGELANVVRWGVDWELIERNIMQWRSFADKNKNVFLCTNSTISIMNVNMISDLIAFCEKHRLRYGFSELTYPEYLSIYQLPVNVREQWKIGNAAFDQLLLSNMSIDTQFEKFLVAMHTLDGYQQVSFSTANKEMYDLVSTYTEQK